MASIREAPVTEQQRNSVKAFAVWLDSACDREGCPLKPGVAERVSNRLTEALPELFDVMEHLAKGRVT